MKQLGTILLAAIVLISAGCMKKRVSKLGNQSTILDPSQPTPECPRGADIVIRPLAEGHQRDDEGYLVFKTGSPVFFSVSASGCSAGYEIVVNGNGRFFRSEVTSAVTFNSPSAIPTTSTFSINIMRDTPSGRQVARGFQIESSPDHPFKIISSPAPMCDIWPNPVYLSDQRVATLDWTPAVSGRLKRISVFSNQAIPESERLVLSNIFPAIPANGLSVSPNPRKFEISTNGKSGIVNFEYEAPNNPNVVNSQLSTGTCSVDIIAGEVCGGSFRGNFLGYSNNSKQNIQFRCRNNDIWLTDTDGTQTQLGSFNFSQNPIKRVLIGQIVQGNPQEGLLVYRQVAGIGKFYRALVQEAGGGAYTFGSQLNQECANGWVVPAAATNGLPESFRLIPATATQKAKVSALQIEGGSTFLYEAVVDISANNSSCSIGAVTRVAKSVRIWADANTVNYNQGTTVRWEATLNEAGYACSVKQKVVSAEEAAYSAVEGNVNLNGQANYSNRSFQTGPILDDTIYKLSCEKAGSDTLEQTVVVNINSTTVPLQVRASSGTGTPPIRFIAPNLNSGALVSSLASTPVYVRYSMPGGTSGCNLTTTPRGGTASSQSVSGQGEVSVSIDKTTTFSVACSNGLSSPISRTVSVGGFPNVKPGTSNNISIPNVDPNTSSDRDIVVQASRNRTKIKIKNASIVNVTGSNWTVNTACDGRELDSNGTVADECAVRVRYAAGGHSSSAAARLAITYQRYNADGVLEAAEHTHAIADLGGSVKPAPPPRRGGRGGK